MLAAAADPSPYLAVGLAAFLAAVGFIAKTSVAAARINERVLSTLEEHGKSIDRMERHLFFAPDKKNER